MVYIQVYRYPTTSNVQLVRLPSSSIKSEKALKTFIKQVSLKLKFKKSEVKNAKLHLTTTKQIVKSLENINPKIPLYLLTGAESDSILEELSNNTEQTNATRPAKHRLTQLPEVIWEIIALAYCEQQRENSKSWLQARLNLLRSDTNAAKNKFFGRSLHSPCRFQDVRLAKKKMDSYVDDGKNNCSSINLEETIAPRVPLRQAIVLSMLNKRWHRIIGTSKHLNLLGSWFFQNEVTGQWIPYSTEASWDMEVARVLKKNEISIAINEPLQHLDGGHKKRGRKRYVRINMIDKIQFNLKKASKGKRYKVKRLPSSVLVK